MSEEISDPKTIEAKATETTANPGPTSAEEAYKSDMFKYKERMKQAESELATAKEAQAKLERNALEKNEEWKTLYEQEKTNRELAVSTLETKGKQFVDSSKINAVVQGIGGFKKDIYSKFIDPSSIEVNEEGTIDTESLNREVERIRQEHPELLKQSTSTRLPNQAPSSVTAPQAITLADMSMVDLKAAFTKSRKK